MTAIAKLDAVKMALTNDELRNWYETEHGVTADDFTAWNVRMYGTRGMGELADLIISDAVDNGVLPTEILEQI